MKPFLDRNFLLQTTTSQELYFQYAANMPVIDYHNHLSPADIANDKQFTTITELWLGGDHYKWRAMRANGINESLITGTAGNEQKFMAWAATVPYTLCNPLYHWTHLELQRYFNIDILLDTSSGKEIYDVCNELLQTKEFSAQNLLRKMNVEMLCTTDDPCDSLQYHKQLKAQQFDIKVLPGFRPDNMVATEDPQRWLLYFKRLSSINHSEIRNYKEFIDAIKGRHDFFAENGCCISDHGVEKMSADEYSEESVQIIFEKLLAGKKLSPGEASQFKSAVLYEMALLDHDKGWVQQWHVSALRNNNTRLLNNIGADAGVDSMGDFDTAKSMSKFLDNLDKTSQLSKTIVYNLNPADSEMYATMMGNFQDGSVAGKMQYGAAWWFLDQKSGIEKQLDVISNMGLISHFIGMITDSRSFLSFPRHEYFRRILCNKIGKEMEYGELPYDMELLGRMIKNICYYNAKQYFNC